MVRFNPATQKKRVLPLHLRDVMFLRGGREGLSPKTSINSRGVSHPTSKTGLAERLFFRLVVCVEEKFEDQVGARDELAISLCQFIASSNAVLGDILVAYATSRESNISADPLDGGMGRTHNKLFCERPSPPPISYGVPSAPASSTTYSSS